MEEEPFKIVLQKKFEFLINHYGSKMDSIKKDIRSALITGLDEWIQSSDFKELMNKTINQSLDKSTKEYMEKTSKIRENFQATMSKTNSNYSLLLEEEDDLNITPELELLISQPSIKTDKSDSEYDKESKKSVENPEKFGEVSGFKTIKKKKQKGPIEDSYVPFSHKKHKKQKKSYSDDDDN